MRGRVRFSKVSPSPVSSYPRILVTYQELARSSDIATPFHPSGNGSQVTEALEHLMQEDAASDRPFIAALAISKARGGLPGPGFFDCARRLGRFAGDLDGQDARTFHAAELNAVFAFWDGYVMLTELTRPVTGAAECPDPHQSQRSESMSGGYPKFRNDRGVPEIGIGVKEFMCVGESPPQDHPHVYINMGVADTILCPYCATRFRFDP